MQNLFQDLININILIKMFALDLEFKTRRVLMRFIKDYKVDFTKLISIII